MSYDYELYCSEPFETPAIATTGVCFVTLDGPEAVEPEDIPDQCKQIVGARKTLYQIQIHGVQNAETQERLSHWLIDLVHKCEGVLIDWQSETFQSVTDHGFIPELTPQRPEPVFGSLDFIFEDSEWFYREGLEAMLTCIAKTMPAAMPVRYGHYEPMQGKVADGGIPALLAAFHAEPDMFMRAKTPFSWIFMSIPCTKEMETFHPEHRMRKEHLLCEVNFELRPKVFEDPKLRAKVELLFEALCITLDVTYARMRSTRDGSLNWRWYGLPKEPTHATCIGPRYQKVWQDFSAHSRPTGEHHLISFTNEAGHTPPLPPKNLLQPSQPAPQEDLPPRLAPVFPFDYAYGIKNNG